MSAKRFGSRRFERRSAIALEKVELRLLCASGALDASFNGTGSLSISGVDLVAIGVGSDGRAIASGDASSGLSYRLYRVNANGTIDTTFNPTVPTQDEFGTDIAGVSEVAVSGTTPILVQAGVVKSVSGSTLVDRFDLNREDAAVAKLFPLSGGKVLAGARYIGADGATALSALAARLTSALALDSTYGKSAGETDLPYYTAGYPALFNNELYFRDVAAQADGKLLLAGAFRAVNANTGDPTGPLKGFIIRLTADGKAFDTAFSGDGVYELTDPAGGAALVDQVIASADGKIELVGQRGSSTYVGRLTSAGALDTSFGGDGFELLSKTVFGTDFATYGLRDLLVQSTGAAIVMNGNTIVRLDNAGKVDATFGTAGKVLAPSGYVFSDMEITSDGSKLVTSLRSSTLSASKGQIRRFLLTDTAVATASIAGSSFYDWDGNGTKAGNEPANVGRTVYLDANNNAVLDAAEKRVTTSSTGAYSFTGLAPATYRVREVLPAGWKSVAPIGGLNLITLTTGQAVGSKNFASTGAGSISGSTFIDTDGNGVKGPVDVPLVAQTVFLDANNNGLLESIERKTTASGTGTYSFAGIVPGTYRVRMVLAPLAPASGYSYTTPTGGVHTLTTTAGQQLASKNFGVRPIASVSGKVFNDLNGDGVRSTNEAYLSGWRVFVDTNENGIFDSGEVSAVTSATGDYKLTSVFATFGVRVRLVALAGWTITAPASRFFLLDLRAGDNVTGKDFGARR